MADDAARLPGSGFLINAAAFVIVVAGMHAASSQIVLLLVAAFVAMVSAPGVLWLKQKRVPAGLAVVLVIGAIVGVLTVMGAMIGASVRAFVQAAPTYGQRLNSLLGDVIAWARRVGVDDYILQQVRGIDGGAIMGLAGNAFSAIGNLVGNSLIIVLIVVFLLVEVSSFSVKELAAFGASVGPRGIRRIAGNVVHYLALKTVISLATGIAVGIWAAVVGLDFALLWGLLAFILNYIPNFGSLVSAIPPILFALVQMGAGGAVLVAVGYVVVNVVIGNIIEPRLMGHGLGLSTLVVFLSLLAWGWTLGVIGMFLAVPLTVSLRIILENHENTRWIAVLMGPVGEAEER